VLRNSYFNKSPIEESANRILWGGGGAYLRVFCPSELSSKHILVVLFFNINISANSLA